MLKSSICDYSDPCILNGTISVANTTTQGADANNNNKEVVSKNYAPSIDCISEINNTQIDNIKDLEVVILMYYLIEYSDNYSKSSRSLWQQYTDEPLLTIAGVNRLNLSKTSIANVNLENLNICRLKRF